MSEKLPRLKPGWDHPACVKCALCLGDRNTPLKHPFISLSWDPNNRVKDTILIVGESPGGVEDEKGKPFVGPAGKLIRDTLSANGIDPATCAYSNAVKCRPPNNKLPSLKPIDYCREFLQRDIERVRPAWILLLGNSALKSVLKKSGIKKQRRKLFSYTLEDGAHVPCIAALHPAATMHDKNMLPSFKEDIRFFCRAAQGEDLFTVTHEVNTNATVEQVHRFHEDLLQRKKPIVACDLETNSVHPHLISDFKVFCASLSDGKTTMVVKLDEHTKTETRLHSKQLYEAWKAVITDPAVRKINHYVKYDMNATQVRYGFRWKNVYCDTLTLDYFLNPVNIGHDLESLAATYLDIGDFKSETNDSIKDSDRIYAMPYADLAKRCGMDAFATMGVFKKQLALLKEHTEQEQDLFWNLYMPAYRVFQKLEMNGVRVDRKHLDWLEDKLSDDLQDKLYVLRQAPTVKNFRRFNLRRLDPEKYAAYREWKEAGAPKTNWPKRLVTKKFLKELADCSFRPTAGDSIATVLFGAPKADLLVDSEYDEPPNFGCSFDAKEDLTPTKKFCTDEGVLSRIKENSGDDEELAAFIDNLLEFKSIQKLLSTYVVGLRKHIASDGRVHSTYNVAKAETGRNSCSDPNLQNQPKTEDQRNIFIAAPGKVLVAADYSQIELRILAAYSKDEAMIEAFKQNVDLHESTARRAFGIPEEESVPSELRGQGKTTNFAVAYGQGAYGLAKRLGITEESAQDLIDALFNQFPGILDWQNKIRKFAAKYGYVTSMFGSRRLIENARLKGAAYDERQHREHAMRQAVNTPVQSTAAHIKNAAIVELDREIVHRKLPVQIILEVHDDITAEMPPEVVDEYVLLSHRIMTTAHLPWIGEQWGDVPVEVEFKTGTRWGSLEKVEVA